MTNLKDIEKVGRKAWLATIGTYAKGWDIISGKVNATFEDTNQLVNELIENGEKVEADLKAKVKANTQLDEKIAALKVKLGVEASADEKLADLSKKVDALVDAVEKLATAKAEKVKAEKASAAPKKAPAKRLLRRKLQRPSLLQLLKKFLQKRLQLSRVHAKLQRKSLRLQHLQLLLSR